MGVVAAELMIALIVSFPLRKVFGFKAWRKLHWVSYGTFVLAAAHGIKAGTDTGRRGRMPSTSAHSALVAGADHVARDDRGPDAASRQPAPATGAAADIVTRHRASGRSHRPVALLGVPLVTHDGIVRGTTGTRGHHRCVRRATLPSHGAVRSSSGPRRR